MRARGREREGGGGGGLCCALSAYGKRLCVSVCAGEITNRHGNQTQTERHRERERESYVCTDISG